MEAFSLEAVSVEAVSVEAVGVDWEGLDFEGFDLENTNLEGVDLEVIGMGSSLLDLIRLDISSWIEDDANALATASCLIWVSLRLAYL